MKTKIIMLMLIVLIAVMPACAQTITMANPQGVTERDIIVYWPNGTMQGYYNSTSVITLESTSDYIFTIKPMSTNPFEDPASWLTENIFPFILTNATGVILIILLIAICKRRS